MKNDSEEMWFVLPKDCCYLEKSEDIRPKEVVSIPVDLSKSMQGKYFVGQSDALLVGDGSSAWAGLVNPHNSYIDLFVNVFTVSNFSDDILTAEIWLNKNIEDEGVISHKVSPTNTAIRPLPQNKAELRFVQSTTAIPENGVNVYERIVPPHTTLIGEEDGKFIEAPGGSYVVVLRSSSSKLDKAIVALGWWENSTFCK
jgi:hypothetical protein